MVMINSDSKRSRIIICFKDKNNYNIRTRLVNVYLLNVPSVSSPYFNKTGSITKNVSFREMARLIARNSFMHFERRDVFQNV